MVVNFRGGVGVGERVVVTGVGAVSPCGLSAASSWEAVLAGRSGGSLLSRFSPAAFGLPVGIACEVRGFTLDPSLFPASFPHRRLGLASAYAAAAAAEAAAAAGLRPSDDESVRSRRGCVVGTGVGAFEQFESNLRALVAGGEAGFFKVNASMIPFSMPSAVASVLSIVHQLCGPTLCVSTACASGTHAVGEAARLIRSGEADVVFAGGAESSLTPLAMAGFASLRALSRRNSDPSGASRPFDRSRDGFVQGEGAGILVLESLSHALSRGAPIVCEIVGYGMSADAVHMTAGEVRGAARAMSAALASAGEEPGDVDYVNAHGTSTQMNDQTEVAALRQVFGEAAGGLSVSSTKGATGHCLAAAGGIEAVLTALSVRDDVVPPTANLGEVAPECEGVRHIVGAGGEKREVTLALSNSFGFGGVNACLVFKKFAGG